MNDSKVNSRLLGAAAEHFVMCELLRRNYIAALAPVGVPDVDIIVSDRVGSALSAVQVQARSTKGSDGGWLLDEKHETMSRPLLFYCFVEFREAAEATRCWIVPSKIVADTIKRYHQAWLITPGRDGKAHNPNRMRRILPDFRHDQMPDRTAGWLDEYFNNWQLISRSDPSDAACQS